jgi:hypothetical protein
MKLVCKSITKTDLLRVAGYDPVFMRDFLLTSFEILSKLTVSVLSSRRSNGIKCQITSIL